MERNVTLSLSRCGQARLAEGRGSLLLSGSRPPPRCLLGLSSKKVRQASISTQLAKFLGPSEYSVQASGQLRRGTVSRTCERGGHQVSERGHDKKKKRKGETEEGDGTKMWQNQTRCCGSGNGHTWPPQGCLSACWSWTLSEPREDQASQAGVTKSREGRVA